MGGLFSKRSRTPPPVKNSEITEKDQAIIQLKTQRDKIQQFLKRKEKCMERERELARQLLREEKKDRALLLLRKKRYEEKIIQQTLQQLDNIQRMVSDLELADIQQQVVDGLRQGNEALKKMNALFNIDEIEKIMDETKEAAEYQEEISNILSGQLNQADMADVEDELQQLLSQHEKVDLPEVPSHALPEVTKEQGEVKEKSKSRVREPVALES